MTCCPGLLGPDTRLNVVLTGRDLLQTLVVHHDVEREVDELEARDALLRRQVEYHDGAVDLVRHEGVVLKSEWCETNKRGLGKLSQGYTEITPRSSVFCRLHKHQVQDPQKATHRISDDSLQLALGSRVVGGISPGRWRCPRAGRVNRRRLGE